MSQPFKIARDRRDRRGLGSRAHGLTLLELMVTVAVLGVIVTVAIPNFRSLAQNGRRTSSSNDLVVALSYARTQALEQHASIAVCRSSNPTSTSPTCDTGTATGWETGWIIFLDANGNGAFDTGETLLRVHEAINTGSTSAPLITLRGSTGLKSYVVFSRYGMPLDSTGASTSGAIAICDSRGWGTNARVVQLSSAGRAQVVTTTQQAAATAISGCKP